VLAKRMVRYAQWGRKRPTGKRLIEGKRYLGQGIGGKRRNVTWFYGSKRRGGLQLLRLRANKISGAIIGRGEGKTFLTAHLGEIHHKKLSLL